MERTAGATLFERSGFGVIPTSAGEALIRRSRRATELLAVAERECQVAPLSRNATTSQLRALIAVVDTGGYSTAARRLGVAQPTVHRAARQLERLAGRTLFERSAPGVKPSAAATMLARYSNLVFAEIRQGFEEIRETLGQMANSRVADRQPPARAIRVSAIAPVTKLLSMYTRTPASAFWTAPYSLNSCMRCATARSTG